MNVPTPEEADLGLPINYDMATPAERREARLKYVEIQDGLCQHCGHPLDGPAAMIYEKAWINERLFPKGMFDHPVHLHHDHDTGMTIGAVHCRCNAYLWQYKGE